VDEGALEAADHFWKQTADRYEQLRHDIDRPPLPPSELWMSPEALRARLNESQRTAFCPPPHPRPAPAQALGDQPAPSLPLALRDSAPGASLKGFLASYEGRVLLAADSAGRREALLEMLDVAGLAPRVLPDFATFIAELDPGAGNAQAPGAEA